MLFLEVVLARLYVSIGQESEEKKPLVVMANTFSGDKCMSLPLL
jgi:hypothetical protein